MESFYKISEEEVKTKPKINIINQEILPMQPEGEKKTAENPTETKTEKKKKEKFQQAISKKYRTPEGKVNPEGISNYLTRRTPGAYGFGDKGKGTPETLKITKANVDVVSRASKGEKSARKLVKDVYKKIETKYPVPAEVKKQQLGFKNFSLGVGAQNRAQAASDAAKDIKKYENKKSFHQRVLQAVKNLPPEKDIPKSTRTPEQKLQTKSFKDFQKDLKVSKPIATGGTGEKVFKNLVGKPSKIDQGYKSLAKAIKDVDKAKVERQAAKASEKVKTAKAWRGTGALAGVVGAGAEGIQGYNVERARGSGQTRSVVAGAARGIGALTGGAIGSSLGGKLGGLPGAVAGGVAGYTKGAQLGTQAFRAIAGSNTKERASKGLPKTDLETRIKGNVTGLAKKIVPGAFRP